MRHRWLLCILLVGCGAPSVEGTNAPDPATEELVPDPITRPMSEDEARREAVRLAQRAFEVRTDILDAAGHPVTGVTFEPTELLGGLESGRWRFTDEPPAGAWMRVSFNEYGTQSEVEVGFAAE